MGTEERPSPSPRKKQRTPSPTDEGSEGASKRRKHRHHNHRRHHHHRHRHHSRKDRDREERDEELSLAAAKGEEASSAILMVGDGELEEGEILEDDGGGEMVGMEFRGGSDVESGEIKPDVELRHNLAPCGKEDTCSDKDVNVSNDMDGEIIRENARSFIDQETNTSSQKVDADQPFESSTVKKAENLDMLSGNGESKNSHRRRDESDRETSLLSSVNLSSRNKTYDIGNGDLRSHSRSRSPGFWESLHVMKDKNVEDNETTFSDHSLGKHNNAKDMSCSPPYRRSRDSIRCRDRSRSHDTDPERVVRPDRVDQHTVRSRTGDAEIDRICRERDSGNHSKHDRRDDWYGHYDREREMDIGVRRERERSSSYSRHDGREVKHGTRDRESAMDKGLHRERGRSSSISSRHDRLEDRHRDGRRERENGRDSHRDRDRENLRDISRQRYSEKDRSRDVNRERGSERDSYDRDRGRVRDREASLDKGREHGRQIERDRLSHRDKFRDSRHPRYDERDRHRDITRSKEFGKDASSTKHDQREEKRDPKREEDEEDYQERIEQQLALHDEEDLDKIKEEARKRRQAILEKYRQRQSQQEVESPSEDRKREDNASIENEKLQELNDAKNVVHQASHVGPEMRQDPSDFYVAEPSFAVGKSPMHNGTSSPEGRDGTRGLGEGTPKSERSADMFCDDIFGESPIGVRKGKGDGLQIERSGLHDNWDDAEGYYSYRFGEVLDGRYEVIAAHGKGVFSTVVRAKDHKAGKGDPEEVAIKIIRNNDTMYKAGLEELIILKKLAGADPDDKRHCVRFLSSFKYRNHLCLVFESLHMNLREVLKKFGRNIGLRLTAVRAYAKQLFIALKHLRNCGVLHCDIKPDNMLVNEAKNVLKLCDFGNAMFAGKNEITPYLVSRFYRAPEIILGLQYDHPMDMWSVGCVLYELYSGKVLFPGPSNNDMLRLHMELKGSFPKKMLRKGAFTDQHFDQDLNFHATEEDPVTRKTVKRLLLNIKPKDISVLISSSPGEDPKMVANFKDLLERIFVLDPEKRMTVSQALSHPFITGK